MIESVKNAVEKVKGFAQNALTKSKLAVSSVAGVGTAAALGIVASADTTTVTVPSIANSVTSDMMNGILTQITDLLPVVLPVVVGALAFRKGLSFLMSTIRGI
ncbi:MAG: hypothetical protein IJT87_13355 [Ruminiclostridium sp.]|nr:hypothetical protein [Ruminiclostridium sp.]